MKKLFFYFIILVTSINYSQCITGGPNIPLNQTVTFTSVGVAQCSSCYDWDINGNVTSSDNSTIGTIKIVNSDMGQSVNIQGITPGPYTLTVNYITERGCQTCTINGSVVAPSCDFTLSQISTVSVGQNSITFQVSTTPSITSGISYTWTATYQDGTTSNSTVNNSGQVTFPSTSANPVVSVCVTANYLTCSDTECLASIPCNLPLNYSFQVNKFSASGGPAYLLPVTTINNNYTYTWIATYSDGSTITTYGSGPGSAFIGCNNGANLVSTTLLLSSAICTKTYTVYNTINWCTANRSTINLENPINEILNLESINLDKFTGYIYDLNGNKIIEFNEKDLPSKDISKLEKKLYLIKIFNDKNEEIFSEKILVK